MSGSNSRAIRTAAAHLFGHRCRLASRAVRRDMRTLACCARRLSLWRDPPLLQTQLGVAFQRPCLDGDAGFLFGLRASWRKISANDGVKLFAGRRRQEAQGLAVPVPALRACQRGLVYLGGYPHRARHGSGDKWLSRPPFLFVQGAFEIGGDAGTRSGRQLEAWHITPDKGIHLVRHFVLRIAIGTDSVSCCARAIWKPPLFSRQIKPYVLENRRKR